MPLTNYLEREQEKTMHTHPVALLKCCFVITSLSRIVTLTVVVGALALALVALPVKAQSGLAFVRVNQLGYATTASKRAYLMASGAETGATFNVKNSSGTTVYSAPIGANLGTWSTGYPDVYALDFGSVTAPGTYTIVTSGPITGSSPAFSINTPTSVYTGGLS